MKSRWVRTYVTTGQSLLCHFCADEYRASGRPVYTQVGPRYAVESGCCANCREHAKSGRHPFLMIPVATENK